MCSRIKGIIKAACHPQKCKAVKNTASWPDVKSDINICIQ